MNSIMHRGIKKLPALQLNIISDYRNELYGISILWIMLFHGYLCEVSYFQNMSYLKYFGKFLSYGNMGVEVFLLLSGICMYFSYIKDPDLTHFIEKRFLRVFPPVFLIRGGYWIYQYIIGELSLSTTLLSFSTLRFWVTGNQQIWFVSLIIVCYLIYPYIYGFLFKKDKGSWFRVLLLNCLVIGLTVSVKMDAEQIYNNVEIAVTRLPVFIIGCWIGKYVYEKREISFFWWILFIILTVTCFAALEKEVFHGIYKRYLYAVGGIPITFIFTAIISKLGKWIRNILSFLGNISLELYLVHILMIGLCKTELSLLPFIKGSSLKYIILLCLCVLLALFVSALEKKIQYLFKNVKK